MAGLLEGDVIAIFLVDRAIISEVMGSVILSI